jgi:hypothetical protein
MRFTASAQDRLTRAVQRVWVGRSDAKCAPSICSILILSYRDFSSLGKRTPTPWVRVPEARGVIQATVPATG